MEIRTQKEVMECSNERYVSDTTTTETANVLHGLKREARYVHVRVNYCMMRNNCNHAERSWTKGMP